MFKAVGIIVRRELLLLSLMTCFSFCFAQKDFSQNWKGHFSYNTIVDVTASNNKVYAAAPNTLFVYNTDTKTNIEYTTINGLSGEDIAKIHFSKRTGLIIVGYENGLIEIINEANGNIRSLVDIQNQLGISPDRIKINNFFEDESILYISTGFGVVEYNLDTAVFEDTYFLTNNSAVVSDVLSVGVLGDFIFVSIRGEGVFRGNKKDFNLVNFSNWTEIQNDVFDDIELLGGSLIAHKKTNAIYSYNGSVFSSSYTATSNIKNFRLSETLLTYTLSNKSVVLDDSLNEVESYNYNTTEGLVNNVLSSIFINNQIYFSWKEKGLFQAVNQDFLDSIQVSPQGPILNDAFEIDAFDGDLWLAYGKVSTSFNDKTSEGGKRKVGVSRLRENTWTLVPFEKVQAQTITDVHINRLNKEQVFFGSFRRVGALIEVNNAVDVTRYTPENSNITKRTFNVSSASKDFISSYAINIDSNQNLWVVNSENNDLLKRFSTNKNDLGADFSIDFSSIPFVPTTQLGRNAKEIVFDEFDNIYMPSYRNGVLGYQPSTRRIANVDGEEQTGFEEMNCRALDVDLNGDLWVGTLGGLRVISNPERMFTGQVNAEPIIILDDGIGQELFFEQVISDIKVDANNNKWIAISGAGVFYISSDGQETIFNFTKDNSPLPSNNVNDMSIDSKTGAVFFATDKGLVEFNTNISEGVQNLNNIKIFPNPVRPEYSDPTVTIEGLTPGANVKITDVEGNLVYEVQNETFNDRGNGTVTWNTKSFSNRKVASGVYLVLVTAKDQKDTAVKKILIVR